MSRATQSEDLIQHAMPDPAGFDMEGVHDSRKARLVLIQQNVVSVSEREFQKQVDLEVFMEQMLVIRIHSSSDKNAPPVVAVGVNGDTRWLLRGRKYKIERKFLECLTKLDRTYTTEDNPDPRDLEGQHVRTHASQSYPFEVLYDPAPKGMGQRWLERMLREG